MDHELMTTAEVAEHFRVSPSQVRRWAATGKLTPVPTPGGHYRFRREQVRLFSVPTRTRTIDD